MQNSPVFANLHPLMKLLILLTYLGAIALLSVINSGEELKFDFSNPDVVLWIKISQIISVLAIFIVPAVLYSVFFTQEKYNYMRLFNKTAVSVLLFAALIMLLAGPFINWMGELNSNLTLPASMKHIEDWMRISEDNAAKLTESFLSDTTIGGLILNLFVVAFLAAVAEEMFFRGILQRVFHEVTTNIHLSIFFTAVLFSAFHMQFFGFLPRLLMGVFLGYLFYWSGSLVVPMVAHFINNGSQVFLIFLINRGVISKDLETVGTGGDAWIPGLISLILVIVLTMIFYKKRKPVNRELKIEPTGL